MSGIAVRGGCCWWQVGRLAGELVSNAFPAVMDLKFERVCQPFMMLHVNRSAVPLHPFNLHVYLWPLSYPLYHILDK